jgi:hypothetical protein
MDNEVLELLRQLSGWWLLRLGAEAAAGGHRENSEETRAPNIHIQHRPHGAIG